MDKYLDETKAELIKEKLKEKSKTWLPTNEIMKDKDFLKIQEYSTLPEQDDNEIKYRNGYWFGIYDAEKILFNKKDKIKNKNIDKLASAISKQWRTFIEANQYASREAWNPVGKLGNYYGLKESYKIVQDILKGKNK